MLALSKTPSEWLFGTAFEAPCDTLWSSNNYIQHKQTKLLWMPFVWEGSWTVNLLIVDCNTDNGFWDDTINT